jgi:hypothetical protein
MLQNEIICRFSAQKNLNAICVRRNNFPALERIHLGGSNGFKGFKAGVVIHC